MDSQKERLDLNYRQQNNKDLTDSWQLISFHLLRTILRVFTQVYLISQGIVVAMMNR